MPRVHVFALNQLTLAHHNKPSPAFTLFYLSDPKGSQPVGQEGLPEGGRAADQPAARPHCQILRCVCGRRPAHHGV